MTTKELRKQLHLTQKQFAEEIGCASSTIFLMEASGRLPGKTIRAKIKERYGVEVTDNLPTKTNQKSGKQIIESKGKKHREPHSRS